MIPSGTPVAAKGATRVLLIVGANRSGTTLVGRLAGLHPGAVFAGEVAQVWKRGFLAGELCGCGEPFHGCPFWRRVADAVTAGVPLLDVERLAGSQAAADRLRRVPWLALGGRPSPERDWNEFVRATGELYRAIAAAAGAAVVVDSSKRLSYALMLAQVPGIDLTVLHVTRDPRAVAFSKRRTRRRPEIVAREVYMGTTSPWRSGLNWTAVNVLGWAVSFRFPRRIRLRYEDVMLDPAAELSQLGRAMDLASGVQGLRGREVELPVDHSVSGNPMRMKTGATVLRIDDEWERAMTLKDRLVVNALTAPATPWFGYRLW